jgi:type VI secretion system secreted protein VgrG
MREHLPIDLLGPLADTFLFHRMTVREELGRLFECTVDCLSERFDVRSAEVLGQTMTVRLELPRGGWRYFDGHVCRFEYLGVTASARYARYRLVLRPWLWFLTRSADCRIFQDRTVPEILREVFSEHGFAELQESLYGEYRRWQYCVQYRETDFDFVSRLMEQEGIYYYFRHDGEGDRGRHSLVLADDYSAHAPAAHYEAVSFQRSTESRPGESERITQWRVSHEIEPEVYSLGDFDFTRPKAGLLVRRLAAPEVQPTRGEVYDYPGEYHTRAEGEAYARTRMEELQARHERAHANASARGLAVGNLFTLCDHPRSDQNREYLVVSAVHTLRSIAYQSELEPEDPDTSPYACELTAMPSHLPYRSPRLTRRPVVEGPQTAIVVGPEGEKVWTDSYGRVKVRFHWDHRDTDTAGAAIPDERRSCWLRVSQNWAGQQWGELYLPHIGQEVIVSFLEGDPDRPLVTGRVYNADQMPPLTLPEEKYKSVIARDHYGNEIVFDGTPGDEHIVMYSPHHRSGLQLGRSVVSNTESDAHTFTYGNTTNIQAGTKTDLFGGLEVNLALGAAFEGRLGPSFNVRGGRELEWTWGDVYKTLDEDYIIDSDQTVSFAAGKGGVNSVIYAGNERLDLSVGDTHRPPGGPWWRKNAQTLWMVALIGGAAALAIASGETASKDNKVAPATTGGASLLALAVAILLSLVTGQPVAAQHKEKQRKAWLNLAWDHRLGKAELDATDWVIVGREATQLNLGHVGSDLRIAGKQCEWKAQGLVEIRAAKINLS